MGDVVHAAPIIDDILRHHPSAQIDWAVEEAFADIVRMHPGVRNVIPVALRRWRKALFRAQTWREVRAVRQRLVQAGYTHIIDCQGLIKSAWVARQARVGVTLITGLDRQSAREPLAACFYDRKVRVDRALHAVERNRQVAAAALGYVPAGGPQFGLRVALSSGAVMDGDEAYAVLLTNASRASKLWPDAHWQVIEGALAQRGLRSVLFWGSESERRDTERRAKRMQRACVAQRCTLAQLGSVLAGAQLVVGLDTGLTHLAAALEAPTLALFCDYDPALVGLQGPGHCENLGGAAGGPGVDEVLAALPRFFEGALAPAHTRA